MNPGKVIILSGPSGAGKGTIARHLLSREPRLSFSVSATSRAPRGDEQEGREYYFLTAGEFRRRADAGEFLEWEEVYDGLFYGTPRAEVERLWDRDRVALFDVDVVGGMNIKQVFGDDALAIFIRPPSLEVLRKRLVARGTDSPERVEQRLARAGRELAFVPRFDVAIVNDRLDDALARAERLVRDFLRDDA
ncbi:MAG: guanylate kinase [Odoribacteraceae bacterium]|jgi:guanylate kinase|nr:guanylate kinase [Odoribacteraceae bacterium]